MSTSTRICPDVAGAILFALALLNWPPSLQAARPDRIALDGAWSFQLDPDDHGLSAQWWQRELNQTVRLPGSLQAQGFGAEVSTNTVWTGGIVDRSWFTDPKYASYRQPGNVKVPFWLQPDKHYVGAAWYQRRIDIPQHWQGQRVVLRLERPHWETRLWLDDHYVGSQNSLSVPHVYDLTNLVRPGSKHRLTLRVDNRMIVDVGENAHSVSDHTQGNWNGVVGTLELEATAPVWIEDTQVYPDVARQLARVRIRLGNATGRSGTGTLTISAASGNAAPRHQVAPQQYPVAWDADGRTVELEYALGPGAHRWDEFSPALYRLQVRLQGNDSAEANTDERAVSFGLREVGVNGTQLTINGRLMFLRGTLECSIFPLTGFPPTDVAAWKHLIRRCQAHGLNHIRFHSWCPPEAAFVAADELGFYFQIECAAWAQIGDGEPIDAWICAEAERIQREYGNHPSFLMLAYGNEPGGRKHAEFLAKLVTEWKKHDWRRLYTSASGWPLIPQTDYHSSPDPRVQAWGGGLRSRINARPPETRTDYREFVRRHTQPVVSHEIGQWCVYPNFDEIPKYTGWLKPKNFEIFRATLEANHLGDLARPFLLASGKLQTLCYKEDIESALRTPGFGGFQLLDLHDFPGQGTALVGVLDPFWDSKGYVTPAEYRRFCGPTVPLARLAKRTWTSDEVLKADLEVAHFGPQPLELAITRWTLLDDAGKSWASGTLPAQTVPVGNGLQLGSIEVDLTKFETPRKYKLVVGFDHTPFENDWDLWVFPTTVDTAAPPDILVTAHLDAQALDRLRAGGKVLLMPAPAEVKTPVQIGFSSIFWNTAWTRNQAPHTLGILCCPQHPALARFPTEFHSNWQWWDLIHGSAAMVLDGFPPELRPLVQPIDTWFENRRLALVFEAQVEGGKLLVCSLDLRQDLEHRPVARQFLHSLLHYMKGRQFRPATPVKLHQINALFQPQLDLSQSRAVEIQSVHADSEAPGFEASLTIDGSPDTLWHTVWQPRAKPMPHQLIVDLGKPVPVQAVACLPRQDQSNGRIAQYSLCVGNDLQHWEPPVAQGQWPDAPQRQFIQLNPTVTGRFVKLTALSEVNGNAFASLAEIKVFEKGLPR